MIEIFVVFHDSRWLFCQITNPERVRIHEFTYKYYKFHEFANDISAFHESRTTLISRIHERFFSFSRIHERKKGISRHHELLWGASINDLSNFDDDAKSQRFAPVEINIYDRIPVPQTIYFKVVCSMEPKTLCIFHIVN